LTTFEPDTLPPARESGLPSRVAGMEASWEAVNLPGTTWNCVCV
jgi:hypothetical protein